jgi:ParB family chromosome partitioning protein
MSQDERDDLKRERVLDIPLGDIDPFPDHPFQVRDDDMMRNTIESVSKVGILTPAIVREKGDGRYELISGHRRKHAAEFVGLNTMPVIVRNLTDDEAIIHMADTNLQRDEILPSEKAFAYKMKLDAMKRQGERVDLTCAPVEHKLTGIKSRDVLAEQVGESKDQVRRYIRLTELIPDLLKLVDENSVAMRPAVEISYLTKQEQIALFDQIEVNQSTPSHAQTVKMRDFSKQGKLTPEVIESIMAEEKPNQVEQVKIPKDRISGFFRKGATSEEITSRIVKGLELLDRAEKKRAMER